MTPPAYISETRWLQVINDAGLFLDSWGAKLAAMGWESPEVFGVHPRCPEARLDTRGLVWALQGRKIIALAKDQVVIETENGNKQTISRRVETEGVVAWELAQT
jgi:hypothetical protein